MDDLIQLAAYVLIFVVIGGASIIKKVIEAQRRRKALEAQRPKDEPITPPKQSRGLTLEEEQPNPTEEEEIPPIETYQEEKEKPEVDLEEVLRKALGFPTTAAKQYQKKIIRAEEEMQLTLKPTVVKEKVKTDEPLTGEEIPIPDNLEHALPAAGPEEQDINGWDNFSKELNSGYTSDLAKAVILSEVIAPPKSLRKYRGLQKRLI
jgi:hypothetical protein